MTPFLQDADCTLYHGDVLDVLAGLPAESVDCVVTSPPYWGLRDYGTGAWEGGDPECEHRVRENPSVGTSTLDGGKKTVSHQADGFKDSCPRCGARRADQQLGLEETPANYVRTLVQVFREVRRVLCPHGTCWVNLGDSYNSIRNDNPGGGFRLSDASGQPKGYVKGRGRALIHGLKHKDLVGIPWRVAFALQADGWWLRSDIVWAKPNPMPESVTDRPTKSHEYVFLLTKAPRYYFDQEAVRERAQWDRWGGQTSVKYEGNRTGSKAEMVQRRTKREIGEEFDTSSRNVRSVWTIATQPYPEAHFATYPEELVRRCVLAGCPERVCRVCGKASERIVEREFVKLANRRPTRKALTEGADMADVNSHDAMGYNRVETLGWSDCGHNDWRPGLVLDPFVGSGTTAKVARDHGRHSIGIDLNADYRARRNTSTAALTTHSRDPAAAHVCGDQTGRKPGAIRYVMTLLVLALLLTATATTATKRPPLLRGEKPWHATYKNEVNRQLIRLARCETGYLKGRQINWKHSNSVYVGGLGFARSTYAQFRVYVRPLPPRDGAKATMLEQLAIGRKLHYLYGWTSWPACSIRLGLR